MTRARLLVGTCLLAVSALVLLLVGAFDAPHAAAPNRAGPDASPPGDEVEEAALRLQGRPAALPEAAPTLGPWAPPAVGPSAGGIVVQGKVIDVQGRPLASGRVAVKVEARGFEVVERVGLVHGVFEVRRGDEDAGRWILLAASGALAAGPCHLRIEPGTETRGVELVAVSTVPVSVRVRGPDGAPRPHAVVEASCSNGALPVPIALDAEGAGTARLLPGVAPWRIDARSPDGRYRGAVGLAAGDDAPRRVDLTLEGPWTEVPVRVASDPLAKLDVAEARIAVQDRAASVHPYELTTVAIGGRESPVLFPPPATGREVRVRAWVEGASGEADLRWNEEGADAAAREGVRVGLIPRTRPRLRFVDPRGRPLDGFTFLAGTAGYHHTDPDGRCELRSSVPYGRLTLHAEHDRPLGATVVDGSGSEHEVVVPGLARVGGGFRLPDWVHPLSYQISIDVEGEPVPYLGTVDAKSGRWSAWLPVPAGRRVVVQAKRNLARWSEPVAGAVGRDDLDIVVSAPGLVVEPRLGPVLRPTLLLRVQSWTSGRVSGGWSSSVTPDRPVAEFCPLHPGTYRVSFSLDHGATWHECATSIDLGPDERLTRVVELSPP